MRLTNDPRNYYITLFLPMRMSSSRSSYGSSSSLRGNGGDSSLFRFPFIGRMPSSLSKNEEQNKLSLTTNHPNSKLLFVFINPFQRPLRGEPLLTSLFTFFSLRCEFAIYKLTSKGKRGVLNLVKRPILRRLNGFLHNEEGLYTRNPLWYFK